MYVNTSVHEPENHYVYETSATVITYVNEAHMYKDSLVY